ncbi:MAG: UvrD-helicase domain-containing protein [Gammaproteobacteria bacterium]
MSDAISATDPAHSCSVLASAGTGKTWQLVARLTRLLLHGARLDAILAITFTRKAAGEMQQRLNERLRQLLEADDATLDQLLAEIGEKPDLGLRRRARDLFETTLRCEQRLRASTFHSFCQELLQRFPLEAELPPGFELAEQTGLLIGEAWDALFAEVTATPDQPLADALTLLFDALNGLHNTRNALFAFVEHRSDWWAYTQGSDAPVGDAVRRLEKELDIHPQIASGELFWSAEGRRELDEFRLLLEKHPTAGNTGHARLLADALTSATDAGTALDAVCPVFFTAAGERRKRKASNAQRKSMGEPGENRFLELHERFCERIEAVREQRNSQRTLDSNRAWYLAGARMLAHFQRIKRERRLLDFADLEWHAYRLLNHPEHAHWIQYKLDQRIDHLLIDEFQDTNPTQWRLILPLLEEIAAGDDRARSLFIVGDAKQSIYRFRRGNPRLLGCASDWMQQHLNAARVHLDSSWRSSPLIMECVNALFQHPAMQGLLEDFQPHSTHRENQWGRLELWPLTEADTAPDTETPNHALRNPLLQPRPTHRDRRHYHEGRAVATRIRQLVEAGQADYADVLILMRSRTHLADYEAALRDAGIPYLSLDRGTLLQSLEIRDLEALLVVLMTPQDNLSLAQVLRSPVFSLSDADLMLLAAENSGSWFERLQAVARHLEQTHPMVRAARLLEQWHALAGRIPIHDLLQQIFHQANLTARFLAAFPPTERARLRANLTRFIELALEVDAGRYPTLPRFLERLRQLRNLDSEGPSQATPQSDDGQRVQLLTIHASKGLEAPVVFLVDSARDTGANHGVPTLVRWPAESDRPSDFLLLSASRQRDSISRHKLELDQQEERREAANLLYVALTRARNMLVISGCASARRGTSTTWYEQLALALCGDSEPRQVWTRSYLQPPPKAVRRMPQETAGSVDERLAKPIHYPPLWREITPSHSLADDADIAGDPEGTLRGNIVHRLLQLAADQPQPQTLQARLLARVASEYQLDNRDSRLHDWWQEVLHLLNNESLAWLMRPAPPQQVYKEIPVQFRRDGRTVFGIIDRLVVDTQSAHIVDYKSHRPRQPKDAERLSEHYRPQLALYHEAVRRLWPDRQVSAWLLLTMDARLIRVC